MKGIFVHDATGKLQSFGIVGNTDKIRAGMCPADGAVVSAVDVGEGDVEKLRSARGHISAGLAIFGTLKDSILKLSTKT